MTKSDSFQNHNHNLCVDSIMKRAEDYCSEHNLRLTPVRRQVLEILASGHKALGAYDILEKLRPMGYKSQPPIVYRSLEFLERHGFVHKIEKLNAYVACLFHEEEHVPAFLICRNCETVAETSHQRSPDLVTHFAQVNEFTIEKTVLEAEGLCHNCKEANL